MRALFNANIQVLAWRVNRAEHRRFTRRTIDVHIEHGQIHANDRRASLGCRVRRHFNDRAHNAIGRTHKVARVVCRRLAKQWIAKERRERGPRDEREDREPDPVHEPTRRCENRSGESDDHPFTNAVARKQHRKRVTRWLDR